VKWLLAAVIAITLSGAEVAFAASLSVDSADVTVFKNTLQSTTTTTGLPVTSIAPGSQAKASASLGWTSAVTPGGTVTYTVYSDPSCGAGFLFASPPPVTVTGSVVADSPFVTFGATGNYYWNAAYSGDGYNQPSSHCLATALVVS